MSEKKLFLSKNRSLYERICLVLEACTKKGLTRTGIFYALEAAWTDLVKVLSHAERLGLLTRLPDGKHYLTTAKGKMYISRWRALLNWLKAREDVSS